MLALNASGVVVRPRQLAKEELEVLLDRLEKPAEVGLRPHVRRVSWFDRGAVETRRSAFAGPGRSRRV